LTKENVPEGLLPKPIVYQMVVKYKAMAVNTILFFIKKLCPFNGVWKALQVRKRRNMAQWL
jgi:hypothetical protein